MPSIPFSNEIALIIIAYDFQQSTERENLLHRCVGALDRIAVATQNSLDEFVPRNFFCRKSIYVPPVQAVLDSTLKFR